MKCPNCEETIPDAAIRCPFCNYLINKKYRIPYVAQNQVRRIDDFSLVGNSNFKNLMTVVLSKSNSQKWEIAVQEWEIFDCEEDTLYRGQCVCGKERLRYLFTIKNRYNGKTIFPIGSSCIKKFDREDLNEEAGVREGMFKLLRAIRDNKFIVLNTDFFSRKLLKALYDRGAFVPSEYNDYNAENDYLFMLDMFNKRRRPSALQEKKIRAIIVTAIRPYLERELAKKIK